jgi:hypothetical protein
MRALFAASIVSILLGGCSRPDDAQEQARKRACPDLKTWAECDARGRVEVAAAQASAVVAKEAADQAAAKSRAKSTADTIATSAGLSTDRRLEWVRQCVEKLGCKQWQVDAIIEGAPATERPRALRVSMAAAAEDIAKQASDGETLSAAQGGVIAGMIARDDMGMPLLDAMVSGSLAEAKKDPASSRGKAMRVSGRIIEIRKSGELFDGAMATDGGTIVHFDTMMSTDGIFEGSYASFRGVFIQEYAYANVSGGQTRSLLLVGAFDIPANRVKVVAAARPAMPSVAVRTAAPDLDETTAPPAVAPTAKLDCNPPFVVDDAGAKHYKMGCL